MADRVYSLTVEGELSDEMALAFEGMSLRRETGRTVLVGPVRDRAHLQELLQRISGLGLALLSVTAADGQPGR